MPFKAMSEWGRRGPVSYRLGGVWVNGADKKGREEGDERRAASERDLEKGEHPRERAGNVSMIATRATAKRCVKLPTRSLEQRSEAPEQVMSLLGSGSRPRPHPLHAPVHAPPPLPCAPVLLASGLSHAQADLLHQQPSKTEETTKQRTERRHTTHHSATPAPSVDRD